MGDGLNDKHAISSVADLDPEPDPKDPNHFAGSGIIVSDPDPEPDPKGTF